MPTPTLCLIPPPAKISYLFENGEMPIYYTE